MAQPANTAPPPLAFEINHLGQVINKATNSVITVDGTVVTLSTAGATSNAGKFDVIANEIDALVKMVSALTQSVATMNTTIGNLASRPSATAAGTTTTSLVSNVFQKPAAFKGERGPDARRFLAQFSLWAKQMPQLNNAAGTRLDEQWITSALGFLQEEAAVWATPALEDLDAGNKPYSGDWAEFKTEFKKRFETHDEAYDAREKLKAMKQGSKQSAADYIAKFEEYAGRTRWSKVDLHTRLRDGLNSALKDALALTDRPTDTFDLLKKHAIELDVRLRERQAEKAREEGKPNPHSSLSGNHSTYRTKDPDAMDIDAAKTGKPNMGDWMVKFKGCCRKCGSASHKTNDVDHSREVCKYCNKPGHTDLVCVSKFLGQDPKKKKKSGQSINAASTNSTSAASTSHLVSPAALETLQQQVAELQAQKLDLESALNAVQDHF
jgi:hypothetical protein